MVVIVMGVAGSGKSTIGRMLAGRLKWTFHDADELHSESNKFKMSHGVALSDDDRRPWLLAIRALVERCVNTDETAVIACSTLKQSYRDAIVVAPEPIRIVYLKGSLELISQRLARRRGHFFDRRLLQSQFDILEEPRDAIVEDIALTPEQIVDSIVKQLEPDLARPPGSA
ncbi:MAG: gluconokinase [Candidatus Binataceae bacterium]